MANGKECEVCKHPHPEISKWIWLLYIIVGVMIFLHFRKKKREEAQLAGTAGALDMDIDPGELARGMLVETEHTDDLDVARKIAVDHLLEDPNYYTKLARIGL